MRGGQPLVLPVDGGALRGHRAGTGTPALLLHGGAAVPDYLRECAHELDGLFETFRYTQRGTPPSEAPPPYSIEGHTDPMPAHATASTAALVPGSRLAVVADPGHFPWLEQPEAFRAAVERLLG